MPIDPVCGIELDENLALVHEHDGKTYYFCCNGCRRIFTKKPRKWKKNARLGNFRTFYKTLKTVLLRIDN